jgi:hypothetical protein
VGTSTPLGGDGCIKIRPTGRSRTHEWLSATHQRHSQLFNSSRYPALARCSRDVAVELDRSAPTSCSLPGLIPWYRRMAGPHGVHPGPLKTPVRLRSLVVAGRGLLCRLIAGILGPLGPSKAHIRHVPLVKHHNGFLSSHDSTELTHTLELLRHSLRAEPTRTTHILRLRLNTNTDSLPRITNNASTYASRLRYESEAPSH